MTTTFGPVTQLVAMEQRLKDALDVAAQHWPVDRRMCECARTLPCPVQTVASSWANYWRARIAYHLNKERSRPRHLRVVPQPLAAVTVPLQTVSRSDDSLTGHKARRRLFGWRLRGRNR